MQNPLALLGDPAKPKTPRWLHVLGTNKIAGIVWSGMRIWLGAMWIEAGVAKLWGAENPGFMHNGGAAVAGFASHGVPAYSWWGSFLHSFVTPNAGWIGVLVALAEFLVGIGLALGLLTPIAALGGLILNFTYAMSGTASVNMFYALFSVVILVTWRSSGWIGLDGIIAGLRQRHQGHLPTIRHRKVAGVVHSQSAA